MEKVLNPGWNAAGGVNPKHNNNEADIGHDFNMSNVVLDISDGDQDYLIGNDEEKEELKEMKKS